MKNEKWEKELKVRKYKEQSLPKNSNLLQFFVKISYKTIL